jgi:hypothetical protein
VIGSTHALATAARGLTAAQADFAAASQGAVAQTDPVTLVEGNLAEARIHATAEVVRTIDDMLGTLVDTVA